MKAVISRWITWGSILALCSTGAVIAAQQPATGARPETGAMLVIRACDVQQGRVEDARKWAAEIAAVANEAPQRPFTRVRAYTEQLGHVGRLHFVIEMTGFEQLQGFLETQPADHSKIGELMKQGPMLLRGCTDTLLREVSTAR
jgi:hypothetical protein